MLGRGENPHGQTSVGNNGVNLDGKADRDGQRFDRWGTNIDGNTNPMAPPDPGPWTVPAMPVKRRK